MAADALAAEWPINGRQFDRFRPRRAMRGFSASFTAVGTPNVYLYNNDIEGKLLCVRDIAHVLDAGSFAQIVVVNKKAGSQQGSVAPVVAGSPPKAGQWWCEDTGSPISTWDYQLAAQTYYGGFATFPHWVVPMGWSLLLTNLSGHALQAWAVWEMVDAHDLELREDVE